MTKEHIKRIHLIYSILLSIVLVMAGICLMAACIVIYSSGDQPFSREAVAEAFSGIAFPVYLCLGMVIAGFALDIFLPDEKRKVPVQKQYGLILKRLQEKADLSQCKELQTAVAAQQRSRRLHKIISGALLILGSVIFLCYALNGNSFHKSEINASMIKAMCWLLPCMLVPFGYALFTAFYCSTSIRREIELLKQADKKAAVQPHSPSQTQRGKQIVIVRCAVLVVGICLLAYGFFAGGTADVLTKAVNICTECVGLG